MPGCQTRHGAPPDFTGPPEAPSTWRPVGATVDRGDTLPGPFGQPLLRLGNALNPFARLDGPPVEGLEPGGRATISAVVAAPTTLSSALVLAAAGAWVELHVDWTETPPCFALIERGRALSAGAGGVERLGGDAWRLALEARNETGAAMRLCPSLHVTSGIGNAGLAVGLYAGLLRAGRVPAG